MVLHFIVNRCATVRAKTEHDIAALITYPYILFRGSIDLNLLPMKAGLRTKDTSGSTLTGKTMADRHSNGVTNRCRGELPTTTRCNAFNHAQEEKVFGTSILSVKLMGVFYCIRLIAVRDFGHIDLLSLSCFLKPNP